MNVVVARFESYAETVPEALDACGAGPVMAAARRIVLKPNLVDSKPHPVTTPPQCVEAALDYCRRVAPGAEVVIAEGSGQVDSLPVFQALGYADLARRRGVEIVDLNQAPLTRLHDPQNKYMPEFYCPTLLLDCVLVTIPVLKAHSMADVTLALKSMFGIAPPSHYQERGHWAKSALHRRIHDKVLGINLHRKADVSLIDATVGMAEAHLWGPACDPPVNRLVAGLDPVSVDVVAAGLLGRDYRRIQHLAEAPEALGRNSGFRVVRLDC